MKLASFGNPWWIVFRFLQSDIGKPYGLGMFRKLKLLRQVRRNGRHPGSASAFFEHLWIVSEVLKLAPEMEGAVAEFGCFRGLSSASLSLACSLTRRKLLVFDSFEGLPPSPEGITNLDTGKPLIYTQGQYCGTLEEVRANVARYGVIEVCTFIKGFFEDTLPARAKNEQFALILEDADLLSSVKTVLKFAWPRLQPNSLYLCHEARAREVVELFFNQDWWQRELGEPAPGFIGSGIGVMTGPTTNWCCLGYTVRRPT